MELSSGNGVSYIIMTKKGKERASVDVELKFIA